jgi:hypothetical protein
MLKEYEGESESEKGYWADVHYYMEQNDCDKETAIKAIDKIYEDYCKKRNEQFEERRSKNRQPKFFRGRPIIQPGEIYDIDGIAYKVITATSSILDDRPLTLKLSEPVFWLDNVETKERIYIGQKELQAKFKDISTLH